MKRSRAPRQQSNIRKGAGMGCGCLLVCAAAVLIYGLLCMVSR